MENTAASDAFGGTRCSLFYLGEFYDNVLISLHGQSSSGWPKKSYNLDFTGDHRFRYRTGSPRVKDIRFLSNYADKAKVRNSLAYEMIAAAGSAGHFAFHVRLQRNAQFFSIADMVEDGDDRWLARLGRDPEGEVVIDAAAAVVSRRHAEIKKTGGQFFISDLKSFNGGISIGPKPLAVLGIFKCGS